jgi:hypothetical protein
MSKKIILKLLILITIVSCSSDDGEFTSNLPYYQFAESDRELMIDYAYAEGDILKYTNQDNETIELRVTEIVERKANEYSRGTFSGGGGILQSHYDTKIITLEIYQEGSEVCDGRVNYIFSKSGNKLKIGFHFSLWNKSPSTFIDSVERGSVHGFVRNPFLRLYQEMEINGIMYGKVMHFKSNSENPYNYYSDSEIFVNEAHYDLNFGIVQFLDINDKLWVLVTE